MKNITITVPHGLARWAKIHAAKMEKSLSRMISDLLAEQRSQEEGYERAMRGFLGRKPVRLKEHGGYPSRDELHERDST